jgi:hypothetical protein
MTNDKAYGRRIGVLLLAQMACGLIFPFVLIDALRKGYPAFLETAAASAPTIRWGIALAVLGAALTIALGIAFLPVLRLYSRQAAVLFVVLCAISATMDLVHNATVLSMLSAAEQFATADASTTAANHAWAAAAGSFRRSVHIMQLVAVGGWISAFYVLLFWYRIVPRPLAILGIIGILAQFVGVTLMMFLGNSPITYLAMPLAPIQIIVAGWLIIRGVKTPTEGSSV